MDDFVFEQPNTEVEVEAMLMWWGKASKFYHHPDCQQEEKAFDCCFGDPDKIVPQAIEGSSVAAFPDSIALWFKDENGNKTEIKPGHALRYHEDGNWMELIEP